MNDNTTGLKTVQQIMAEENLLQERVDENGATWKKVYLGSGAHFRNWLEQCRELGEVFVEEVDPAGLRCYEGGNEKLQRIWMKPK
jgi:hypothetical protein